MVRMLRGRIGGIALAVAVLGAAVAASACSGGISLGDRLNDPKLITADCRWRDDVLFPVEREVRDRVEDDAYLGPVRFEPTRFLSRTEYVNRLHDDPDEREDELEDELDANYFRLYWEQRIDGEPDRDRVSQGKFVVYGYIEPDDDCDVRIRRTEPR